MKTRPLSDAIIELNIARKNVLSYPKGHPLIEATIDKAFNLLKNLLTVEKEITIGVAKDTLMVEQEPLDKKNPIFKEFALALFKKGIASISFTHGLSKDELIKFHELISSDATFENIVEAVEKAETKNIKIKMIDFRAFQLTEEERLDAQQKLDSTDSLWHTFIRGLLEGTLDTGDYDEALESLDMSPASMAEKLNEKSTGEIPQAVCEKTIARFLSQVGEDIEEHIINLNRLAEFISNLKPELKRQFLSGTLKYLSVKPDLANDILSEFPEDLIIDALKTIIEKDSYVPPSILSLLQKLTDIGQSEPVLGWARVERETLGDLSEDEIKQKLTDVFKEDTISSDYRDTLTGLIDVPQTPEATDSAEKVRDAVGKANIEEEEANVIFEILEKNITYEEFSKLIWKLRDMSGFFLSTGQFNTLAKIYDVFAFHTKSDNKMRAALANEAIQFFYEKDFMEEVINGFNLWGKEKYVDISMLIRKTGAGFIPLLLDTLSKEDDPLKRRLLVELLSTFGTAVTSEVTRRIKDSDTYLLRNFITILRHSKDKKAIPVVQRFIKHPDPKIQIEALRALLHLKAPDASAILKDAILSRNNEISYTAIFLAGVYKMTDVIELLVCLLRKRLFWGVDFEKKEACVKALCEIGDPKALPGLRKVYKSKSLFNRKALIKLKMSIIRSMEKYSFDDAVAFLEAQSASGTPKGDQLKKAIAETLDKITRKKATQNG